MKILLTGGAGFIGSHIAEAYLLEGHEVVIFDNLSSGKIENIASCLKDGAKLVEGDINDLEAVNRLLEKERPQVINHHAAQISVRQSVLNPSEDANTNIIGLVHLAHAAQRIGKLGFIFASSGGAIYGEQNEFPATEAHPCQPMSPYGVSKLCGENYLEYFFRCNEMPSVCFRYANVYGPRQDPHGEAGVVAIFSKALDAGQQTFIFGDGEQTRDFIFVKDVVSANVLALSRLRGFQVLNIGSGRETSVNQLHQELAEIAIKDVRPSYQPARAGEQRRSCISAARVESEWGWKQSVSLKEGLRSTALSFRN